jgi:DnaJ-domain-containing protein 1
MRILILKDAVQYNLSEEEVRQQLADRRLSMSDRASCEGAPGPWIPLEQILHFIAAQRADESREGSKKQQQRQPRPPERQSTEVDHHTVLGVSRNASPDEIKAAYRQRMQEYHPDKVAHLGRDLRTLAERKAKEINEAYEALGRSPKC